MKNQKKIADGERAFVTALHGGCSSPVAAYAQIEKGKLILSGLYVNEESGIIIKGSMSGEIKDAKEIGTVLAQKLKGGN